MNNFYRICGITTFIMMLFFVFDILVWILLGPYPNTSEAWFLLLNHDKINGILLLSLPTFFGTILYFLTFLGLYYILKTSNSIFNTLALIFSFVGLIILINTNFSYTLIYLSDKYAIAITEFEKTILLAAGESKLATMTTGILIGGFFVEASAIIFSIIMLKSNIFNNITAYLGILGHGLDFIRIVLTLAFIPEEKVAILLMIGGLPQIIWLVIIGVKFLKIKQVDIKGT